MAYKIIKNVDFSFQTFYMELPCHWSAFVLLRCSVLLIAKVLLKWEGWHYKLGKLHQFDDRSSCNWTSLVGLQP